jgi:hypothetical protein
MNFRILLAMFLTSLTLLVGTMSLSAAQTSAPTPPAFAYRLTGSYINVFVGQITLDSTVRIPANERHGEAKFVDQGGDGGFYGLRLGYGVATGMWYIGGELEGVIANNVRSRLSALGAEYRARLQDEGGAYVRAGYSPDGTWLMYGRAGLSVPRQLFEIEGNNTARRWQPTPVIGVGAEFVSESGVGIRLDWSYGFATGTNAIETYRATAALVYHF